MRILAIDPGNTESGWVIIDTDTYKPLQFGKTENMELLMDCYTVLDWDSIVIEMVASYGMAVGAEVFETCVWIGRFFEAATFTTSDKPKRFPPELVYRRNIKLHHCGTARAKDANITQALIDRFAHGAKNYGKGTKANPGFFYGFKADIWQAYALAVYAADEVNR